MANRLMELEQAVGTLAPARRRVRRRKPGGPAAAKDRVAVASQAVDYKVSGIVDPIRQPSGMTCWATVATMMLSWREQASMPIATAIGRIGSNWLSKFQNNQGLAGSEKVPFLAAAGLAYEYPQSLTAGGWEGLLRRYGPLWVTTDEQPGAGFAIHARILTGIHGDGTPGGTTLDIVDPARGTAHQENFGKFIEKYQSEALDPKRALRIQIVHWPHDAGFSVARSLALQSAAYSASLAVSELEEIEALAGEPDYDEERAQAEPVRAARALSVTLAKPPAMTVNDVRWAADNDSPEYRHLAAAIDTTPFRLTGKVIERLAALNRFGTTAGQKKVVFGLRGCTLDASVKDFTDGIMVREATPNHYDNLCIIGVWDTATGRIAAFQASTVPNWKNMEKYRQGKMKANMLPTGRYLMTVGTHRPVDDKGNPNKKLRVRGALRNNAQIVVLRSQDDLSYTVRDLWDKTTPYDNIHAAYVGVNAPPSQDPDFSSAGCNTIPGSSYWDKPNGSWADFRVALGMDNTDFSKLDKQTLVYILLTGREARMCATGVNEKGLRRLRFGSKGPEVRALQEALSKQPGKYYPARAFDEDLGPGTAMGFIQYQQNRDGGAADGVVTPTDATTLGFSLAMP